ncbi:hypothetical protein [Pseudoalteromonas peptidolytica]|uniref:Uncharacterized protein n=1 Tax=Pseudoalteromonas peptidolytica F12-50-A1 TaxID=1315280 RepID=A0A8I0T4Y8_9GAMM|nr:hypothetical protein [Pseudoalteromonas peptidolytica]MBE0346817.1 hypothetical protein [Pseudoalteromonas peptidolytica F12-50-A1]NLR13721.1 hypothetical protein [Pseudoalteromonas peptidolytica]GEK08652.1 hypothetical protein PPE03_09010 [Pseudoalteromonas peptidolytica]
MKTQNFRRILFYCAIVALLPLLGLILAELFTSILKCNVSQKETANCTVAGVDIGMILAVLYTGGWVGLVTTPIAAILALLLHLKTQ